MAIKRDLSYLRDLFPFADTPGSLVAQAEPSVVLLTMSALGLSRIRDRGTWFRSIGPSAQNNNLTNPVPAGKCWVCPYAHAEHDAGASHPLQLAIWGPDTPPFSLANAIYVAGSQGSVGSSTVITSPRTLILGPGMAIGTVVGGAALIAGEHAILGLLYWEVPAGEVMDFPS